MTSAEPPLPPSLCVDLNRDAVPPHPVGAAVTLRSVREVAGRGPSVNFAVGTLVLRDDAELIVTATPAGSQKAQRVGRRSGPRNRCLADADWDGDYLVDAWDGGGVVRMHRPGTRWSIWRFWEDGAWSDLRYGNLESPWVRTPMGYDTQDWTLDVLAEGTPGTPDWTVSLKDEDELNWYVEHGERSAEEAAVIRAAGTALSEAMLRGDGAADAEWAEWEMPADAGAVELDAGWQSPAY